MSDSGPNAPTARALLLGLFLIFFGLVLGTMTIVTLIGPLLGILLAIFGVFLIWQSCRTKPRDPML